MAFEEIEKLAKDIHAKWHSNKLNLTGRSGRGGSHEPAIEKQIDELGTDLARLADGLRDLVTSLRDRPVGSGDGGT